MCASKFKTPIISVLMPVFNEEKYLDVCLQSIVDQDFSNWELIAVDDFSSDRSCEILDYYSRKHPRIKFQKNRLKGIIPALQLALRSASGEIVSRMDADDIMPVDKLSTMYSSLKSLGPGNVVSGKVTYFSDSTLHNGFKKYETWINQQLYYEDIYKECTLPSACWMAYKEDLMRVGGFDDAAYPEDYDLLFRFYKHDLSILGIDKPLHLWRDHPERASRTDPNYKDQNFFHLKVKYFFDLDWKEDQNLVVWGAGRKGKSLVKEIMKQRQDTISFQWLSDNEKKVGKHIYGHLVESRDILTEVNKKQVIVAISDQKFQVHKGKLYEELGLDPKDIFEFC